MIAATVPDTRDGLSRPDGSGPCASRGPLLIMDPELLVLSLVPA